MKRRIQNRRDAKSAEFLHSILALRPSRLCGSIDPCFVGTLILLVAFSLARAASSNHSAEVHGIGPADDPTRQTDENWVDDRWQKTDVGQFLSACIETPEKTHKGIAIKIGEHDEGAVCFDTELLRYSAGWTGGFLELHPRRYGLMVSPKPQGPVQFKSKAEPGWARDGSFKDPRREHLGNLPQDWGRYSGLYLSGKRVVLAYRIANVDVLDSPWFEKAENATAFTRTIEVGVRTTNLQMHICEVPGAALREVDGVNMIVSGEGKGFTAVALLGNDARLTKSASDSAEMEIHPNSQSSILKALIFHGARSNLPAFAALVKASPRPTSLKSLTHGGSPHWTQPVITKGSGGFGTGPLVIDTLTVPYENPWKALMFTSGHDFFDNGDAAVCTAHGDVWRVSGIDDKLQKLTWKRFATGLYQPLGLKIIHDHVYVLGRDQITVLSDLNGDGEADDYKNFNNDCLSTGGGHSYATCLETDRDGNFYFLKCAENTPHGGALLRVSADGKNLQVIATGFRNPNGLGISPAGLITAADQQGEWVPETRLDAIRFGGFYGYMPMHHKKEAPKTYDGPLCWIARTVDNSAGGQVWVPKGTWGPLSRHMIHLSYGRCTMMLILPDGQPEGEVLGRSQAGIVPLPGRFLSGVMRGRFNPHEGQLYLTGLRGWQTAAVKDGCFQRVRYTGKPFYIPIGYSVRSNGIELTFSQPLQSDTAENIDSYSIERWNYRWSATYGSPDYSVADPNKQGRDALSVKAARLSNDQRTLFLELPELRPAMQMKISYNIKATDGKALRNDFYATINKVPAGP